MWRSRVLGALARRGSKPTITSLVSVYGSTSMTEYAVSTNLICWAPARVAQPLFGWPDDGPEGDAVKQMGLGDVLVLKFSQNPEYRRGGGQVEYQRGVCDVLGVDYETERAAYNDRVARGEGAVPLLMRVTGKPYEDTRFPSEAPWCCVPVEVEDLPHPLSTQEFLRLRAVPVELARQFKATAARGRHIQAVPMGTADAIRTFAATADRSGAPYALRQLSLVRAAGRAEAEERLAQVGRGAQAGDYAFLALPDRLPGLFAAKGKTSSAFDALSRNGEAIEQSASDLRRLFIAAKARKDPAFRPMHALEAASELVDFLAGDDDVKAIDDYATFHDRYVTLAAKTNAAIAVTSKPKAPDAPPPDDGDDEGKDDEEVVVEEDELEALLGLDVAAVAAELQGIELPPSVLAEAVTSLRSGKHLLLSGPPGTGKSTIAGALCRAVRDEQYDVATATADWTSFDTIGGYLPASDGRLVFAPGLVLRCLERGWWLVIDELNRADIDKAFGPLFTLLAGGGAARPNEGVVLPFLGADGKPVEMTWAETRADGAGPYTLTPAWRLIGTLNVSDKTTLFQLSFAFLRRFAIVDVPLPPEPSYRTLFAGACADVDEPARAQIVDAGMKLAFGRRQLGPAILLDIAHFVRMGLTQTVSGRPYGDPIEAFLAAVRLYAVPQYEGATTSDIDDAKSRLRGVCSDPPEDAWNALSAALDAVALS